MPMHDPISDFLTRIRNAQKAKHSTVEVSHSNMKARLADVLRQEGFISDVRVMNDQNRRVIRLFLRYRNEGEPMIRNIEQMSRPGCRFYTSHEELTTEGGGVTVSVLTTSKGILTDRQAREAGVGGEIIFRVM